MRKTGIIAFLLILCSALTAGTITVENGGASFRLKYRVIDGVRYTSTDAVAALSGNRFYSAIKRKESLSIGSDSYVFSPNNPFVIVGERTYRMDRPTLTTGAGMYIPLEEFLEIFADRRGLAAEIDGDRAVLVTAERPAEIPEAPEPAPECPAEEITAEVETTTLAAKEIPEPDSVSEFPDSTEIPAAETAEIDSGKTKKTTPDESAPKKTWLVMIDPGHGGKDPGASAADKTREKELVLDIALELAEILESDSLFEVRLTREEDIFIPLRQRTEMANSAGADLFLSIHCNAARNKSARGTQVFFLAPASSDHARATAALENASIFLEEADTLSDLDFIMADVIQNEFLRESSRLAVLLEEAVAGETGLPARGPCGAGFYVLKGSFMPAVLVESAFLSNIDDAALLRREDFRRRIAGGMAAGLREFVTELPE